MGHEDEVGGREHKLVMYTSSGLLDQYFSRYGDDISKIIKRNRETTTKELSGGISGVLASLRGLMSRSSEEEFVEEINLNDDFRQVRALINVFSDTDLVYPVETLVDGRDSPTGLYKFDTNLQLYHTNEAGEKMIRVRGIENKVDFTGLTSPENWSSRSFASTALSKADPFPFEGVFKPLEKDRSVERETVDGEFEIESLGLTVQFLYILAPDTEDYINWSNYQKLLQDHPKDINQSGIKE